VGGATLNWNVFLASPPAVLSKPRWPGLDRDFHDHLVELGMTPDGEALRRKAEARFLYAEGKPFLLGPPQMVRAEFAEPFRRLTRVYHRAIETIVRASCDDEAVRNMLSTPPGLAADLAADRDPANCKLHICRLDLLLEPEGGFWVLETNANCPGGFVFSGICNRAWREFLDERGYPMPPALEHEAKGFMAEWVLRAMEQDTGVRPDFLAFIREEGGNRLELGDFANHVRWQDVDCEEIDPREIEYDGSGPARARGRAVTHAYQKLGMQTFQRMRTDLDAYVAAVRDRALVVQNGQRGRWVGDDKLCLAIISDPEFRYLFDEDDWDLLQRHVPWSRNARLLDSEWLQAVRGERERYVLKRGLDTRGQGVVVGAGVDQDRWNEAVDTAEAEGWLVQAFHETTWIERDFDSPQRNRHDLALGAINGELTTLFTRSSGELRVNMARSGRMHPVFMRE
jgi:hypothetical protein